MTRELGRRHGGGLATVEFLGAAGLDDGECLEASVDLVLRTSIKQVSRA